MPRTSNIDRIRNEFFDKIKRATSFIDNVRNLSLQNTSSTASGLHPKQFYLVYERSFLKVMTSWEELLERTFIEYLVGAKTLGKYKPMPRVGTADSKNTAYRLLSRDINFTIGKNYLNLSNPKWVSKAADLFFTDHPYEILLSRSDLIIRASHIRNHIAHTSTKSKADFTKAAYWFMQFDHGDSKKSQKGYSAGKLLQEKAQRHFNEEEIRKGKTIYGSYCCLFQDLANAIVPPKGDPPA